MPELDYRNTAITEMYLNCLNKTPYDRNIFIIS